MSPPPAGSQPCSTERLVASAGRGGNDSSGVGVRAPCGGGAGFGEAIFSDTADFGAGKNCGKRGGASSVNLTGVRASSGSAVGPGGWASLGKGGGAAPGGGGGGEGSFCRGAGRDVFCGTGVGKGAGPREGAGVGSGVEPPGGGNRGGDDSSDAAGVRVCCPAAVGSWDWAFFG